MDKKEQIELLNNLKLKIDDIGRSLSTYLN